MYIIRRDTIPTTTTITYAPQSDRPYQEQTRTYETNQTTTDKKKNQGLLYVLGDWNARPVYHTQ